MLTLHEHLRIHIIMIISCLGVADPKELGTPVVWSIRNFLHFMWSVGLSAVVPPGDFGSLTKRAELCDRVQDDEPSTLASLTLY